MRTPWRQLTTRAEESTLHSLQTGYAGHHPRCDLGTCDTGPMFLCSLFEISSALRARLVTDRWSPGHKREICWITFCLVSAPVGPCGFPCVCALGWHKDIHVGSARSFCQTDCLKGDKSWVIEQRWKKLPLLEIKLSQIFTFLFSWNIIWSLIRQPWKVALFLLQTWVSCWNVCWTNLHPRIC